MKKSQILILFLSIGFLIGSCKKKPEINKYDEPVNIELWATIINNNLQEISLLDETASDVDLTINGHSFCYGTDINSYTICNQQNINNFENIFGQTAVFKADNTVMSIYCPEIIFFEAPQIIDLNNGFDITWNTDPNNTQIKISIIPRIDANGTPYNSENTNAIQITTYDDGHYVFTSQELSVLNSGDIVDIVLNRGNNKSFFRYLDNYNILVRSMNIHIAMAQ